MKIAILSDIHDHVWNLQVVLGWLPSHEVEALLFCGDFCSPFVMGNIQSAFQGPVHAVFGNNDGDTYRMTRFAADHMHLHGELAEITLGGKCIGVNHFPEIARRMAQSRQYDLVCFGHNHQISVENIGNTLLVNPGTVMGYSPGKKETIAPTFGVYDSEAHRFEAYGIDREAKQVLAFELGS